MLTVAFAILLLTAGGAGATDQETVRLSFSQRGLDFAEDVIFYMIDIVRDLIMGGIDIPTIAIPNGPTISNLEIEKMEIPKPALSFVKNMGIKMKTDGASLELTGDFAIAGLFGMITRGQLTLKTDLTVEATAGIEADMSGGRFKTLARGCSVDFSSLSLDLHDMFLNFGVSMYLETLKQDLRSVVCSEIDGALSTTINGVINSMPEELDVGELLAVHFAPDSQPTFRNDHVDVPCRVAAALSSGSFPFSPEPMGVDMDPAYMGCFLLSDYTINTATYVTLGKDEISEILPNDKVAIGSALLNTAYFKKSLPALYNAHPDKALTYKVWNVRYPKVEFDHDLLTVQVPLKVSVRVDGSSVLTVRLTLEMAGSVAVDNAHITGSLDSVSHETKVLSSKIGSLSASTVNSAMDGILQETILPEVNEVLKEGFTLPVDEWVNLNRALVETHDDFLRICADFSMTDWALAKIKEIIEEAVKEFDFSF